MNTHKIMITFTERQMDFIKKESEMLGSSMASVVRRAITEYFQFREV